MNTNIEYIVKSADNIYVDYIGWRRFCGESERRDNVDCVFKDEEVSSVSVRFMDDSLNGVMVDLADGEMHLCECGEEGCHIGYITQEDIKALLPIYNRKYLDQYLHIYKSDEEWLEWVESNTGHKVVGIRDGFSELCFNKGVTSLDSSAKYDRSMERVLTDNGNVVRRPYALED